MLQDVNAYHAESRPADADLRARSSTFDVARGLMLEAPEALEIRRESRATLASYGIPEGDTSSFGYQCLIARRLIERGVRVVELIDTGSNNNWDAHGDMQDHRPKALRVDRAIAALLKDLKHRGLLSQTLVAICTEFGRTPWTDSTPEQGPQPLCQGVHSPPGRGGSSGRPGVPVTDEFGINITSDPVHVHDYHATILHLMGIDHTRLVYRYAGRDFRLTDVDGNVMKPVLS